MTDIIKLAYSTIHNYYHKEVLQGVKNNNFLTPLTRISLIIGAINLAILFPLLFFAGALPVLITFIVLTAIPAGLIAFDFMRRGADLERLDSAVLQTASEREEFFKGLKEDLFFNLKTAALTAALPTLYQLVLTAFITLVTKMSFLQFLVTGLLYLLIFSTTVYLFLINYFLKKRDRSGSFFKIESYRELQIAGPLYLIPFAALFFITTILILSIFLKSLIIKLLFAALLTSLFTFLLHLLFKRQGFYDRNKRQLLLKKYSIFTRKALGRFSSGRPAIEGSTVRSLYFIPAFIGSLSLLLLANRYLTAYFSHPLKITIFQATLFSLFFIYPLLKRMFYNPKHSLSPFLFTSFLCSIVLFNSLISHLELTITFEEESILFAFKQFIEPLINGFNLYITTVKSYQARISFLMIPALPLFFTALYYLNYLLYKLIIGFEKFADSKIKRQLNREESILLFGDSLSLYPVLFSAFFSFLLIIFLQIELPALGGLIFHLIDTLQIGSIFKFDFLTKENIDLVFKALFYLSAGYLILRVLLSFISSILSHFMLFNNEIVYLSDNLIFKTTLRIPLSKINYVVFKQNLVEKLLDIGTIFIETNDRDGLIKIKGINNINEKNILIMEKIKIDLQKT